MPAYSIQFRRGTAADHSAFTGELAEITIDITNNRVVLHDGETAGGIPLAKVSDLPIDVGDLTDVNGHIAAANIPAPSMYGDRGLFAGGTGTTSSKTSAVEYIDITTAGDAATFGTLNTSIANGARATNGTIAIFYDEEPSFNTNRNNYMTIPGNPGGVTASEA